MKSPADPKEVRNLMVVATESRAPSGVKDRLVANGLLEVLVLRSQGRRRKSLPNRHPLLRPKNLRVSNALGQLVQVMCLRCRLLGVAHQSLKGFERSTGLPSGLIGSIFSSPFWASNNCRACSGVICPAA